MPRPGDMRNRIVSILLASCQEMPAATHGCTFVVPCGCLSKLPAPMYLLKDQPCLQIATVVRHGNLSKAQYPIWVIRPGASLNSDSQPRKLPWQPSRNHCARCLRSESSRGLSTPNDVKQYTVPESSISCTSSTDFGNKVTAWAQCPASRLAGWQTRGLRALGSRLGQSAIATKAYAGLDPICPASAEARLLPMVIVFDIETSGFSKKVHRIVEFAARDADGGDDAHIHSLIYPGAGNRVGVSQKVHHISDEMLPPSLPTWGDFFPKLCAWVESRNQGKRPVLFVAHNGATFDVPFIVWESARAGWEVPQGWRFVDSLRIAHKYVDAKQASLDSLRARFQVPLAKAAHRAPADVDVTLHVLSRMLQAKQLPLGVLSEFAFAFGIPGKTQQEKRMGMKEEEWPVLQQVLADGKRQRQRQQTEAWVGGQGEQAAEAGGRQRSDGAHATGDSVSSVGPDPRTPQRRVLGSGGAPAALARASASDAGVPLPSTTPGLSASPVGANRQEEATGVPPSRLQTRPGVLLTSIADGKRSCDEAAMEDGDGAGTGVEPVGGGAPNGTASSGMGPGGQTAAIGSERVLPPLSLDRQKGQSRAMPWPPLPLPTSEVSRGSAGGGEEAAQAYGIGSSERGGEGLAVRPLPPWGMMRSGDASGSRSSSVVAPTTGSAPSPTVMVRGPGVVVGVGEGGGIDGRTRDGDARRVDSVGAEAEGGTSEQVSRGSGSDVGQGRGPPSLSEKGTDAASSQAVPSVLARYRQLARKIAAQSRSGQSVGQA